MIFVSACNASAQAPRFKLSQKSLMKVEQIESAEKKLKVYKKVFHRDSVRFNRRLKRYYKHYEDSLYEVLHSPSRQLPASTDSLMTLTDSLGRSVTVFRKDIEAMKSDSSNSGAVIETFGLKQYISNVNIPRDNITGEQPDLKLNEHLNEKYLKDIPSLDKINVVDQNQSLKQFKQYEKINGEQFSDKISVVPGRDSLNGFVKNQMTLPGGYGFENATALTDTANTKAMLKKQAEELAKKYIDENPASLQQLQRKMSRMMRKYSVVPNSNDLSTAVKRTSLEGRRFKERLFVAGNFQTPSIDPLTIDFSPAVGYRINSRFTSGIGGMYRQSFADSIPRMANAVVGYKFFTCYDVINQFYFYGELAQNSTSIPSSELSPKREWTAAAFAGVGRKFMIHSKVESTIVILYNFLYEKRDPIYTSPWALRVGFQSSILGFR